MKHILKNIFCLLLALSVFFADSISIAARKKKKKSNGKRAAATSTSSKHSGSSSSKKSTKSKKLKSSSKDKSSGSKAKKNSSKSNESATEQDAEITKKIASSAEASCLKDGLAELLEEDCSYLNDEWVLEKMNQPLLCAYSVKTKGKVKSATEYFVTQKYGVKEVKKDASVSIKDNANASAYYQYLLDGLEEGTLKHTRILDFITEAVLEDSDENNDVISAIENKSVESTKIVMDIVPNDVTNCQKSAKKILQSCNATTAEDVQELIEGSCSEFESALIKQTAYLKNEVLDKAPEIVEVLKQRVQTKSKSTASDDGEEGDATSEKSDNSDDASADATADDSSTKK